MPAVIAPAAPAVAPATPAAAPVPAAKAPAAPAAAPPAAAPEQMFDIKINGQVKKFTRAEVERLASKAGYADQVIQQSKEQIRAAKEAEGRFSQSAEELKRRAKERTDDFLREHGVDPDEYARAKLEKKVDEGKLTPDQKRALQAEQEAQKLKDQLAERDKLAENEKIKARTTQIQRHVETTLAGAAKRAGIEPGDSSFAAIHEVLQEAFELGLLPQDGMISPMQADVLIEEAQAKMDSQFGRLEKAVLGGLTGEALLKRVGDKVAFAVSQALVQRIRGGGTPAAAPPPGGQLLAPPPAPEVRPRGYTTEAEADAAIRKLGGGR